MKSGSGDTLSLWMATAELLERPALSENLTTDVCVVGAGIAGLSIAYHLAKAGKKVVVIDDGAVAGGETSRTTAHLSNAIDDRYYELEKVQGLEGSRIAAESHTAAISRIEQIIADENIMCDFLRLDGWLFLAPGKDGKELDKELAAAHRAGLTGVTKESQAPIINFNTGACLRFPGQAQFHPLKYINGLVSAIERLGGRVFCKTHADSIVDGRPARVRTGNGFEIRAAAVAVATNSPVNDRVEINTKQMPYRSYVVGARVPHDSVALGLFWDTDDPYHYARLQPMGSDSPSDERYDVLIVGGADHKTGQADDFEQRFSDLEGWTKERWPQVESFEFRWSGQVMETDDYVGFIGRNPLDENIYIATGDSGMGMTHGTIAGMLITDLILGRENPWAKLYDPARIRLRASGEWLKENLNSFAQYRDYVTPGEVSSVDEIAAGEGAVLRHGLAKIACYRDEAGVLHRHSAICPHLGAIVRWNGAEKTWDCPAHGSRFSPGGCVVNGPANSGLPKIDEEKAA